MTRYDGRLAAAARPTNIGALAWKKQTVATQVWVNDGIAVNDTLYFCKLPKGAAITGGRLYGNRLGLGTSATSVCFGLCLGVDAICFNGSGTSFSTASLTSGLGGFTNIDFNVVSAGVVTYATNTNDSGWNAKIGGLLFANGPLYLQADGNVFATITCVPVTGSAQSAYINLELDFITAVYA